MTYREERAARALAQHEAHVARQKALDARWQNKPYDGISVHVWDDGIVLGPGVYTEQFGGRAGEITNQMNRFHRFMAANYRYTIVSINPVQWSNKTCMYVTFQIH